MNMNHINKLWYLLLIAVTVSARNQHTFADEINEQAYGRFSGNIQTLFMGRRFDNRSDRADQLHSATIATTINYQSPTFIGLSLGGQYIHVSKGYSRGDEEDFNDVDPGYILSNSDYTLLNNAYLRYNFAGLGLENTVLTVGHQALDLNFVSRYNIRQKDQSFEAVVFESSDISNMKISFGILDKFSSWSSRDDLTRGTTANGFIPVEKTEGATYTATGIQFVDMTYKGFDRTRLSLYDYYGDKLYNTFGITADYTVIDREDFTQDIRFKYIGQRGIGTFERFTGFDLRSDAVQAGLKFSSAAFSIEPGIFIVTGDGEENNLRTPFQPKLIIEEPLVENDIGFLGGSRSFYLESNYQWSNHSLYMLYLYTHYDTTNMNGVTNELDILYTRNLTENWYARIKLGLFDVDGDLGNSTVFDYRIFVGYNF